ncbi:MAG: DUF1624 domain-containing protein [Lachnospiraceae bacterium]|nr:DUF1624 domain-containing protein [Lachnospiraceae bacterium]
MKKERLHFIDTIRGMVLLSMILYHASWNLVYMYHVSWPWFHSKGAYYWQQSICWTFIFISGFCFPLAKHHIKSGSLVFGSGILVTIVTLLFMPQNRVVFGVLSCIGSCILLLTIGEKWLKKIKPELGSVIAFLIFLVTKHVNAGYLGFGSIKILKFPKAWYSNYFTAFWGFPFPRFFSTDYFSVFPWIFLFATGFYVSLLVQKRGYFKYHFWKKKIEIFAFAGRHSLIIYLLHQPIIFALQEVFF